MIEGTFSRWHRVNADEAWHHYEGAPVTLLSVPSVGGVITAHQLGPVTEISAPLHVIPAGWWQSAQSTGSFSFMGCSLGPGFEYDDFSLLSDIPEHNRPDGIPSTLWHTYL